MALKTSLIPLLSAACLAVIAHTPTAQAAKICKSMVWGYGLHANKNIAKLQALGEWTANAKSKYGAAYGNYGQAKSKSQKCRREGSLRNAKQKCVVKGRPCAPNWGPSNEKSG